MSRTSLDTTDVFAFAPTTNSNSLHPSKDMLQLATSNDANEFELTFLDEFLLHDELVPDPHSPTPSDDVVATSVDMLVEQQQLDAALSNSTMITGLDKSAASFLLEPAVPAPSPFTFGSQLSISPTPNSPSTSDSHSGGGSPTAYSSSGEDDIADAFNSAAKPLDSKARRRAQVAISARRHRCRKKHELLDLRKEVTYLDAQLDFLRSKHKMLRPHGATAEWEERAMAQRHKRKQSEEQNEELRRALFLQGSFVANFKVLFHGSAMAAAELNMRQLLHTYTRLGTNPRARLRDYDAICTDAKLDLAIDVIVRETAGLDIASPAIDSRTVQPAPQQFGATTVAAYAFDTLDMRRIFVAACGAIRDSGREWPSYAPIDANVQVVDAPRENVRYGVSSIRYRSDDALTGGDDVKDDADDIIVESRAISYYRVTETYGVLLWDFVDVDDLYPLDAATTMKRDVIGAVLVRREVCADGVERVVCRSLCTKIHSFSLPMPSPGIKRFSQSTTRGGEVCGSVVYNHIRDDFSKSLVAA